jgi:transposase
MDTSKHFFQLHGVDAAEQPVLRRKLRRKEMVTFFGKLPPTVIGMEACGASHYWARELGQLGHTVKLIAPQHVKPYIKRNKNDGRDAEALCEAMSRPTMQFVPVKTEEQQAALMLVGMRERLVARRTQLSNAIRGHAAEFGLTAAKGLDKIEPLLAEIAADEALPALTRELFAIYGREYAQLQIELKKIEARVMAWHRGNADSRRLAQIPGIGPIVATALVMKAPDPRLFPSGRHFAAWIGLTPKDHSTAGKTRLGTITRAGDEMLAQGRDDAVSIETGEGTCHARFSHGMIVTRGNKGFACARFVWPFFSAPSSPPLPLTPPAAAATSTPSWRRCRRKLQRPASRKR